MYPPHDARRHHTTPHHATPRRMRQKERANESAKMHQHAMLGPAITAHRRPTTNGKSTIASPLRHVFGTRLPRRRRRSLLQHVSKKPQLLLGKCNAKQERKPQPWTCLKKKANPLQTPRVVLEMHIKNVHGPGHTYVASKPLIPPVTRTNKKLPNLHRTLR